MPASVSKVRLPTERLLIVVVELDASTVKMPDEPPISSPIEKRPALDIVSRVVDAADAVLSSSKTLPVDPPTTESLAQGVVVPMPIWPARSVPAILPFVPVPTAMTPADRRESPVSSV
jgi:hypothetical protein